MKLSFEKDSLLKRHQHCFKRLYLPKTTMPILECILIDASGSEIKLTGNDMELGIETKVEGLNFRTWKIALEAKLFPILSENYPEEILRLS